MTTESIKDKAEFDTEVDLLTAAAARADELEAKATKMLAAVGLTPDPKTTAVRQVVRYLQEDLAAHFEREGLSQPSGDGLQLGDVVRLRSGGPTMTINSYSTECCVDDLAVKCAWFVDRDNVGRFAEQVQSHSFAAAALVKVGGKDGGKDSDELSPTIGIKQTLRVRMAHGEVVNLGPAISVFDYLLAFGYEPQGSDEGAMARNHARVRAERARQVLAADAATSAPGTKSAAKPTLSDVTGCLKDLPSGIAEQLRQRPVTVTRFADGVKTTTVQVEPGQSVAEALEVLGKPILVNADGSISPA